MTVPKVIVFYEESSKKIRVVHSLLEHPVTSKWNGIGRTYSLRWK